MAAVLETKSDPAEKFSSAVDEQIAQATSRIRVHDLTLGGLTLAAMVAVYATTMILLDKYLTLPEGVRQLALVGFLAAIGAVGYFLIVRPLVRRINPLYAAARVEDTIDDAKNSVTGYVEAQEKGNVHAAVKAAMSARAARAVGEADVNHAVDHRNLLVVGGVFVAFLLALGVLLFVFRPTQFSSLIGRAFVPFSSDPIASRTQLTLVKPDPTEPTISTGQTITVAVRVGGKIPVKTEPTRVRLLLRHNPADPNYEEIEMVEGETSRDWQVKVPEYLVQNGFWYKVAGGDAETPEYKVTVRSLPLFTDFEVRYEYPAYTRKLTDKANDPNIHGYRGTKVTLLAQTNREVKDGTMKFEAGTLAPVAGTPVAGKPDTLLFQFTLTEATRYRLYMTTTTGERSSEPPPFNIALDSDQPPRVEIVKPELKEDQPETVVPANGQLAIDATVGDDFGIDKVRLRLKVEGGELLAPLPYMGGKSFLRAKDKSWPTDLAYKGSADLTKLKLANGQKFEPKEGMLLEYWVEAIDNCTEAPTAKDWGEKPQNGNVGASPVRKLRLAAPKTEPEEKQAQEQKADQRNNEEKQHNQQQEQKFDNENRDPKKQPQDKQADKKEGGEQGDPKEGGPKKEGDKNPPDGKQDPMPKGGASGKQDDTNPKKDNSPPKGGTGDPAPKKGDEKTPPDVKQDPKADPKSDPSSKGGMGGMPDPNMKTDPKKADTPMGKMGDPNTGTGGMSGTGDMTKPPEDAPMPRSDEDKQRDEKAKQVQEQLNRDKGAGGDAKPNPDANPEERTEPAQPKPQPMGGGEKESKSKEGPKPADPSNPMNPMGGTDGKDDAAKSKPEGKLEQPKEPSAEKPQPGQKDKTGENRDGALGGTPGQDKESPQPKKDGKEPNATEPKNPNKDAASGSEAKPATQKKDDQQPGMGEKRDPAEKAGAPKPQPDNDRGTDKRPQPQPQPMGGGKEPDPKAKQDPNAGDAKPDKAQPAAEKKPAPKEGPKGMPDSDAKDPPKDTMPMGGNPGEAKPEKPMGGNAGENGIEKGSDKPDPKDQPQGGAGDPKVDPKGDNKQPDGKKGDDKTSGKGKKLDDKQLKDIQDAAKDLNDPDPKKQQAARDKLDKTVGKDMRQAIEEYQKNEQKKLDQLEKDLQSKDENTRKAAEKKLDELNRKAEEMAKKNEAKGDTPKGEGDKGSKGDKGKELSKEDAAKLAQKAPDLNSDNAEKRKAAESEFDDKLGKEAREKLQEELKKQPQPKEPTDPKEQEELRKKIEEMAKQNPKNPPGKGGDEFKGPGGGANTTPPLPGTEADPRNKARTAELQLEEFEKRRNDRTLLDRLKWTEKEYDDFLKDQAKRVEQLQKQAAAFEEELRQQSKPGEGAPTLKTDSGGKVEGTAYGPGGTSSGATFAPPGFDEAKKRFQEAAKKLQQKR